MLSYAPVWPGERVADFGAGSGAYLEPLSASVGNEGSVYALDAYPEHLSRIHRARVFGLQNVYPLEVDLNEHIPLADNLLHGALVVNTLYALTARFHFIQELSRVTVRSGRVLFVEWMDSFKNIGPTPEQVVAPGEAVRLFRSGGFSIGAMLPAGTHHFAFLATKQ